MLEQGLFLCLLHGDSSIRRWFLAIYFGDFEYLIDLPDIRDLWKAVLKHRRDNVSGNRDSSAPSSIPKVGTLGNDSGALDVSGGPLFVEEQVFPSGRRRLSGLWRQVQKAWACSLWGHHSSRKFITREIVWFLCIVLFLIMWCHSNLM